MGLTWAAVVLAMVLTIAPSSPAAVSADIAEVNGTRLYYDVAGRGRAVVLIHGGNLDSGMWDDQFSLFAKRWTVVRYDVRPYGRSGGLAPGSSSVEDLRGLLDFLKIRKTDVVGLSLGGRIAIDFALAYPNYVDRLVLVGPGLTGFRFSADPLVPAMFDAARQGKPELAMRLWLQHPYMAPAMAHANVAAKIRPIADRNVKIWTMASAPERVSDPPAIGRLREVRAPTLLVVGEKDVPDIQEVARLLMSGLPDVRKLTIAGTGHMVNMERPNEFNRGVTRFLDR